MYISSSLLKLASLSAKNQTIYFLYLLTVWGWTFQPAKDGGMLLIICAPVFWCLPSNSIHIGTQAIHSSLESWLVKRSETSYAFFLFCKNMNHCHRLQLTVVLHQNPLNSTIHCLRIVDPNFWCRHCFLTLPDFMYVASFAFLFHASILFQHQHHH